MKKNNEENTKKHTVFSINDADCDSGTEGDDTNNEYVHNPVEIDNTVTMIQKYILEYVNDKSLPLCEYLTKREINKFIDFLYKKS